MAKTRHSFRDTIRIKPDTSGVALAVRACASPGCQEEGAYRVPKSREELSRHLWFCLTHARAHNESWDYFRGMSEREIERFRVDAVTGHRPTWPLGKRAARLHDPLADFDFNRAFGGDSAEAAPPPRRPERQVTRVQLTAFDTLNLEPSATLNEIKARYKELVKRFHPDANGGDRGAEERLKQVIKAYGVLRASGLT
ncbi:MAG: J domain-containing protein [Alphaproteobacteria bacterium]|nr:J domain-containing protein [Alphaproteobacteria bacterium]MBV9695049.1 J domain-containing protein [Alphaproteobacteria bacterium]